MKYLKAGYPLILALLLWGVHETTANADIVCDATLTAVDQSGNERTNAVNVYIKSDKVKLEWQNDSTSFILRSDLQALLTISPSETAYYETDFSQLYTTPFGPMPLMISPGFGDPIVEFIDTGEAELINGLSCRKYVITEIASFRLLQYTIYATDELDFAETFSSFFSSATSLKYKPFEEMRKIPGLPVKIAISETVGGVSNTQTYEFSNYQESSLNDSLFSVPEGYSLQ